MPYIPPHLRPGYVAAETKVVDYSGKPHWPTDLDSHRQDNIIQPTVLYSPVRPVVVNPLTLGIAAPKRTTSMKLVSPITPNLAPVARPSMKIHEFPPKFRSAVVQHLKRTNSSRRIPRKGQTKRQARRQKKARILKSRKRA